MSSDTNETTTEHAVLRAARRLFPADAAGRVAVSVQLTQEYRDDESAALPELPESSLALKYTFNTDVLPEHLRTKMSKPGRHGFPEYAVGAERIAIDAARATLDPTTNAATSDEQIIGAFISGSRRALGEHAHTAALEWLRRRLPHGAGLSLREKASAIVSERVDLTVGDYLIIERAWVAPTPNAGSPEFRLAVLAGALAAAITRHQDTLASAGAADITINPRQEAQTITATASSISKARDHIDPQSIHNALDVLTDRTAALWRLAASADQLAHRLHRRPPPAPDRDNQLPANRATVTLDDAQTLHLDSLSAQLDGLREVIEITDKYDPDTQNRYNE